MWGTRIKVLNNIQTLIIVIHLFNLLFSFKKSIPIYFLVHRKEKVRRESVESAEYHHTKVLHAVWNVICFGPVCKCNVVKLLSKNILYIIQYNT